METMELVEFCPLPACGKPRAKKNGRVFCENPKDHPRTEGHYYEHIGRDKLGRWHWWKTSR